MWKVGDAFTFSSGSACIPYRTQFGELLQRCHIIWIKTCYVKRTIKHDKDVTPFPDQFDVYDINKDGQITLKELAKATNTKEPCALHKQKKRSRRQTKTAATILTAASLKQHRTCSSIVRHVRKRTLKIVVVV